ncbi:MAG: Phosphoesterase RecJ-like protein [Thermacetogenium phaeum]|uniref:Phosphoesterase RecJ-like protein n=1 Tax=Thermacetogenium phaeum TaxID=85874 RepID=A0A124FKC7_9THEO|nr:MAG: Phosphoesterase RecJ-like protein [Thermacetogenium phaeum]
MGSLDAVARIIEKSNKILMTTHVNPDGDAVGSLLGLGLALVNSGKDVMMVTAAPIPAVYQYLPGSELLQLPSILSTREFEAGVVLDCTDLSRIGGDLPELLNGAGSVVNIDHHISNTHFGDVNAVDPKAAATGEIVLDLLLLMGIPVTPDIATNLYTALITDTGSFRHQNTTARCHRTAAVLLEYGADHVLVHNCLYEQRTLSSLMLLKAGLETLSLSKDGRIAWMAISYEDILSSGCNMEDCEGIIDYPKSLRGVEVGILFKEVKPGEIKVSFRSKQYLDVNRLAASFGGGGHERAAGCTVKGNLADAVAMIVRTTEEHLRLAMNNGGVS